MLEGKTIVPNVTPLTSVGYTEEPWYPTGEPVPAAGDTEEPWYEPDYSNSQQEPK